MIPNNPRRYQPLLESRRKRLGAAVVLLALSSGCASTRVTSMTGRALVELDEAWAAAAASGKMDASMDFWTESAVVFLPNLPPAHGKTAIREIVDRRPPGLVHEMSWTPSCAGIDERGSMAYTLGEGHVSVTDGAGATHKLHARYVAIWRKEADRWRCAVKSWTPMPSDSPGKP